MYNNLHKKRKGPVRVWYAALYSTEGLKAAWHETAFRTEALLACVMLPLATWLGRNWVEVVLLIGSVLAVMIVELLNTAVESVVDRVSPDWHNLSKRAKDIGSAAVMLSMFYCGGLWLTLIWLSWGA